jgi:hypothetical protein
VLPTVVENAPPAARICREGGTFSREFFTEPKAVVMQVCAGPARSR